MNQESILTIRINSKLKQAVMNKCEEVGLSASFVVKTALLLWAEYPGRLPTFSIGGVKADEEPKAKEKAKPKYTKTICRPDEMVKPIHPTQMFDSPGCITRDDPSLIEYSRGALDMADMIDAAGNLFGKEDGDWQCIDPISGAFYSGGGLPRWWKEKRIG